MRIFSKSFNEHINTYNVVIHSWFEGNTKQEPMAIIQQDDIEHTGDITALQ